MRELIYKTENDLHFIGFYSEKIKNKINYAVVIYFKLKAEMKKFSYGKDLDQVFAEYKKAINIYK